MMKPDQERVKNLLTDTVTLLCKNGLFFNDELRIEGLLGVTIDNKDAFFVHISEKFMSVNDKDDSDTTKKERESEKSKSKSRGGRIDDSPHRKVPSRPPSQQSVHSPGSRDSRPEKRRHTDTPPHLKIKQERADEDVMIIDSKRRVPLPHGSLSQDDATAMRQTYGIELPPNNSQQIVDTGGGAFVTGMVRNLHEQSSTDSPSNTWQDLAAQVTGGGAQSGDSQVSFDSLPGASSWPAASSSQLATTQPSASDMMHYNLWLPPMTKIRKSSSAQNKPHKCIFSQFGCSKSFHNRPHMYRHKKNCPFRQGDSKSCFPTLSDIHHSIETNSLDSELKEDDSLESDIMPSYTVDQNNLDTAKDNGDQSWLPESQNIFADNDSNSGLRARGAELPVITEEDSTSEPDIRETLLETH